MALRRMPNTPQALGLWIWIGMESSRSAITKNESNLITYRNFHIKNMKQYRVDELRPEDLETLTAYLDGHLEKTSLEGTYWLEIHSL